MIRDERRVFTRIDWESHVANMTEKEFRRFYRMKPKVFYEILHDIAHKIKKNEQMGYVSTTSGCVEPRVRLAVALRFLAGGSYLDISKLFGVSENNVYTCVWDVVLAVNETYDFPWMTKNKLDVEKMEETLPGIAEGFKAKSDGDLFDKCIGALDGWLPIIAKPPQGVVGSRNQMYCIKGFYSVNVQAVSDAKRHFLYYDISCYGSTHDSLAFLVSSLYDVMSNLHLDYYLVADAAYTATEWCLVPFKGNCIYILYLIICSNILNIYINVSSGENLSRNNPIKDTYNFYQSQVRINVECAFGSVGSLFLSSSVSFVLIKLKSNFKLKYQA